MKRVLFAIVCVAMAAIACNKEIIPEAGSEVIEEQSTAPESDSNGPRAVTFNAVLPNTKVAVDVTDDGKVSWDADDAIAVYNTDGTKFKFTVKDGAGTNNATFECLSFEGTVGDLAVYPEAWAGTTKKDIEIPQGIERDDKIPAVMASNIEGGDETELRPLYFKSLMAVIEFTLQDVPAYARALKIQTENGIKVSGTYTINDSYDALETRETGESYQYIYFPYGTAYGAEGSVKICAAIPNYEYTDLKICMLDGDEAEIEGTEKKIPNKAFIGIGADSYICMPELKVSEMVTRNYIGVEGVKWAKGNLRAWKSGSQGEGWQTGWNIYDNQWESQYMLMNETLGNNDSFRLDNEAYTEDGAYAHWDYFSWGTISHSSRVSSCPMTSLTASFSISGKIFDLEGNTSGNIDSATQLSGDDRWVDEGTFGDTDATIAGDLAFWASKGQYRMPTRAELGKLNSNANQQAGYYMIGNKKVSGILFTSRPSWEETRIQNTNAVAFETKDIESGLFLPKIGDRSTNSNTSWNDYGCKRFNSWGIYWSGTYGARSTEGFDDCAYVLYIKDDNAVAGVGYTYKTSSTYFGQNRLGNPIRPVWIPEGERE